MLYLHGTKYEPADRRPQLANTLWGQYVLDNFKTVSEAVVQLRRLRVVSVAAEGREWPLHLAIEDASGDSAVIEFVKGRMVVHHGRQFTTMTNEPPLAEQLANLKRYKRFGGKRALPGDIDPQSRYVRAASFLEMLAEPADYREAVAYMIGLTRTVSVPFGAQNTSDVHSEDTWPTRWITVSDLSNRRLFFMLTKSANVFWLELTAFDPASADILAINPTDLA